MPKQTTNHIEVLNKQIEDFTTHCTLLKDKFDEMDRLLKKQEEINKKISKEHEDFVKKNFDIDISKKETEKKFSEANSLEAVANQKCIQLNSEIQRVEARDKELDHRDQVLQTQREELVAKEQDVQARLRWVEVEERSIKATRLAVDKLIRDSKLKEIIGENNG